MLQNLDLNKESDQKTLLKNVEMIKPGRITYDKKVAIIINPNTGKQKNSQSLIEYRLSQENIQFEFFHTERYLHAFEFAYNLEIDQYSAIIAAGGDGTIHEVVNGMLHRPDKKKIPIALIPNGTGNDLCAGLTIKDIDTALDYIVKGDLFKMDAIKVLIDHEKEEDIPEEDKIMYMRYELNNNDFGLPSRASQNASYYKKCLGKKAYDLAGFREIINLKYDKFDLYMDDQLYMEDVEAILIMFFNGKLGGGGMMMQPFAVLNDGFLDVAIVRNFGVKYLLQITDLTQNHGGIQCYDEQLIYLRAKTFRIVNKNQPVQPYSWWPFNRSQPEDQENWQLMGIDGEHFKF